MVSSAFRGDGSAAASTIQWYLCLISQLWITFLPCRNLQLAFGSLMNSNRAPIHAGDTVENPLRNIAGLDNQPVSFSSTSSSVKSGVYEE